MSFGNFNNLRRFVIVDLCFPTLFAVSVSNTDPSMINFFIDWANNCLKIPREKINIQLHLYADMDIKKEVNKN
jgi:hypothetical protein